MKVLAGIIGSGVGISHLKAINMHNKAQVVSLCEKNKIKRKLLKKKFPNLHVTGDEKDIFHNKKINLVSIASYDNYHFDQLIKAIKFNKHVIVEKPLCLTKHQLLKIYNLSKKKKLFLTTNLVLRVNDLFNKFKKKINKKNLYYIEADYLWGRKHKLLQWRSKIKNYSLTLGAGIHVIDLIIWLAEEKPVSVQAFSNNKGFNSKIFKKDSFFIYILKFSSGLIAKVTANGSCSHDHFHEVKIFEKNRTIVNSFMGAYKFQKIKNKTLFQLEKGKYPDKKNRNKLIINFIDQIINNKNNFNDIKEAIDVMTVCFACDESVSKKKQIKINYLK